MEKETLKYAPFFNRSYVLGDILYRVLQHEHMLNGNMSARNTH
jgi:hypothetical protein